MPYFIGGVTADHNRLIARRPEEFKSLNGVELLTGHRVVSIDAQGHRVRVADLGRAREFDVPYSRLLISTGARAFVPPVEGAGLEGVFTLRRLDDSVRLKAFVSSRRPATAVVVGSGPVGLEMCESFRRLGLEVTLVEMAPRIAPTLDPAISEKVLSHLEENGVKCLPGQAMEAIEGSDGAVRRVLLPSGAVEADAVLLAIGVRPVTELARNAGAELGAGGAVKVDGGMRTSVEDIFAAGDCATTTNSITGEEAWLPLGSTSRKQGRAAADCMFGGHGDFPGVLGTSVVKCFDMTVGRTGLGEREAERAGFEPVSLEMDAESLHDFYPGGGAMYLKLTADRPGGRVLGCQMAGDLRAAVEKRVDVFSVAIGASMTVDEMRYLDLAYAPPYSTTLDVPIVAANVLAGKISGRECSCDWHGME